jgi:hypothetical protein
MVGFPPFGPAVFCLLRRSETQSCGRLLSVAVQVSISRTLLPALFKQLVNSSWAFAFCTIFSPKERYLATS